MEPNTGAHHFTLPDARGIDHRYVVTEMAAGPGMEIMFELLGLGAPSLLALAGAAMKSEGLVGAVLSALQGESSGVETTAQLGKLASDLDFSTVGSAVERALGTGKAPGLVRKMLVGIYRDGRPLDLDLAFQANYSELLALIWKVCQVNHFFPLPSTGPSSSDGETPAGNRIPSGVA